MLSTMQYVTSMANQGLVLDPFAHWNGTNKDFEWTI